MAVITKPVITDDTGQDIVDKLDDILNAMNVSPGISDTEWLQIKAVLV